MADESEDASKDDATSKDDEGLEQHQLPNKNDEQQSSSSLLFVPTTILRVPTKMEVITSGVASQMGNSWSNLMILLGLQPTHRFQISDLNPEPSDITHRALELATQLVPLVNHMIRTYYFGLAINHWKGKLNLLGGESSSSNTFDREAFWVACVLHDTGISTELSPKKDNDNDDAEKEVVTTTAETFFEVRGGQRAHKFVTQEINPQFSKERAWLVHEAIALHTSTVEFGRNNNENDDKRGIEWAEMLFDGASTDLVGAQLDMIHPDTLRDIHREHPRNDLHSVFPKIMSAEACARPQCLIAVHYNMGLFDIIAKSGKKFQKYDCNDDDT